MVVILDIWAKIHKVIWEMDHQEDHYLNLSIEVMANRQLWARQAWASKKECKTRAIRKPLLDKLINKQELAQREHLAWWEAQDKTVSWVLKELDIVDNTQQMLEE